MSNYSNSTYNESTSDFQEVGRRSSVIALWLGIAIIATPFLLGRSYAFYLPFVVVSLLMTILWRKAPRPWISLVSMSAASPIAIAQQQFNCNLIFAFWFAIFNRQYLFKIPKWIFLSSCLALLGIATSSLNWMSSDIVRGFMREGANAYNFFLGPFLLLPIAYLRMSESQDHTANLKGLLFFLIIPSTVLLFSAKVFGTVANWWEASQHMQMLPDGFLQYRLGKVIVNFLRTEVGFILAALICASVAITIAQVKGKYRLLALVCLAMNVFLLLSTGSFGSIFACFCGLLAIFYSQFRKISGTRAIISLIIIGFILIISIVFAPQSTKQYLEQRYEHRVVKADTDRLDLWARAVEQIMEHPEGVGLTLSVGDKVQTFIHNDYLTYFVSYGFFGGLGYLLLVTGLIISFLRLNRTTINDPAALAVYLAGLGVIIALAANSMTDHSNENRWYFNAIWSIIWYCYFCSRQEKDITLPGVDRKE